MMEFIRTGPRYLGGAILCALINNVSLIAGDQLGIADIVSVLISSFVGGTAGYLWHSRVTFRHELAMAAYVQFMAGMAIGIPLTWLSILFFRHVIGWPMTISSPATTLVLFVYNYANARLAIRFRKRRLNREL